MPRIAHTRRPVVALSIAAASALALSACTGTPDGGSGEPDTSRLIIAVDSDAASLGYDPARYSNGQRFFFEGIYESLFELDGAGQVVPQLVTEFSYNDEQTELTLELDTSATFADGSTLSAELVKQNLDARGDADLSAYTEFATGGEAEITDVVVVDEDTVTLVFPKATPGFESNLVFPGGAIVGPTGAADRSSLDTTPDGSGPLAVDTDATVKGNTYLLTKKEDYAGSIDLPFDSYEFRPIIDPQGRINALLSGDVDVAFATSDTVSQIESGGKAINSNGGTIFNLLPFDKNGTVTPAFGDERVRRALSIAIDREAYVAAVHPGETPTANVLPADNPGYDPELEDEFAYDPEKAKALLAEAGYPNGFDFEFTITPGTQRDLEAIQPYWAAIGVNVTLKNASSTEEAFAAVQKEPLGGPIPLTWTNPAGNVFGVMLGFANYHKAENPALLGAFGALGAAQDDAARAEALTEFNRVVATTGWLIPLYEQHAPWGYDEKKVGGFAFPGAEAYPLLASFTPAS